MNRLLTILFFVALLASATNAQAWYGGALPPPNGTVSWYGGALPPPIGTHTWYGGALPPKSAGKDLVQIRGSFTWHSASRQGGTCDSEAEMKFVLNKAYDGCLDKGYARGTCKTAISRRPIEQYMFTSQTGGWNELSNTGTYSCSLAVDISIHPERAVDLDAGKGESSPADDANAPPAPETEDEATASAR